MSPEKTMRDALCRAVSIAFICTALTIPLSAAAGEVATATSFDVPAGPLRDALANISARADVSFVFDDAVAARHDIVELQGTYFLDDALDAILSPIGLAHERVSPAVYRIVEKKQLVPDRARASVPRKAAPAGLDPTEQIVVSTLRSDRLLVEMPISVSTFGYDRLEMHQVTSAQDVMRRVPNAMVSVAGRRSNFVVSLRGISNIGGLDRSIAYTFDDLNIARGNVDPLIHDVERIEVARGPQGAIYGRSAIGGAINVYPVKPHDRYEAFVEAGYGRFDSWTAEGVANIPLSDKVAVRAAAYHESEGGFIRNGGSGGRTNDHDYTSARLSLLADVSDRTTFGLMVNYGYEQEGLPTAVPTGVFGSRETFPPDQRGVGLSLFFPENTRAVINDLAGGSRLESWIARANAKYEARTFTASASFGYVQQDLDRRYDEDNTDLSLSQSQEDTRFRSLSGEFRVASRPGRVEWVVGVLYVRDTVDRTLRQAFLTTTPLTPSGKGAGGFADPAGAGGQDDLSPGTPVEGGFSGTGDADAGQNDIDDDSGPDAGSDKAGVAAAPLSAAGGPTVIVGTGGSGDGGAGGDGKGEPSIDFASILGRRTISTVSVYGEVRWRFLPDTTGTVGLRYIYEDIGSREFRFESLTESTFADSYDNVVPRVSLTHNVNDRLSVYATAAKAFKSGGFNQFVESFIGLPEFPDVLEFPFEQETVWMYEAGLKGDLNDGRLRFAVAAFYADWKNVQLANIEVASGFRSGILNGPGASTKGVEAEVTVWLARGLELRATGGYLDARFNRLTGDAGGIADNDPSGFIDGAEALAADVARKRLLFAPKWTASADLTYRRPIGNLAEGDLTLEWDYRSAVFTSVQGYERAVFPFVSPGRSLWNIRAGVTVGAWRASAFVENVFGKKHFESVFGFQSATGVLVDVNPRRFGFRLSYAFN